MAILSLAELLDKALMVATEAHKGQTDKGGHPYILHPLAVAGRVKNVKQKIIALLHDVLEDTSITVEDLKKEGFHDDIIEAIIALTRKKGETYTEFCERVAKNILAIDVKIADIKENNTFERLSNPTEEDIVQFKSRSVRYEKALKYLYQNKVASKREEFHPGIAIPPAETLKEMMEEQNLTLKDLHEATGIPLHLLQRIMTAEARITEFLSEKLGRYFQTNLDFFYYLEEIYQESMKRLKEEDFSDE